MAHITYTSITAELKGFGIKLIATAPDDEEKEVFIPMEDIKAIHGINHRQFFEKYQDNEDMLWELFASVNNIQLLK